MTVVQLNPANQALAARLTATPKTKTVLALDLAAMSLTYPAMLAVGKVLDLSTNVVERARGLLRYASPELLGRVRSGEVSMNAALLEAFPKKAAGVRARREAAPACVVHVLTPDLISTQRLTDEVHVAAVRAFNVIVGLPRSSDVVETLTAPERDLLRRAYQRLEEMTRVDL